jgi:hypothetical protein
MVCCSFSIEKVTLEIDCEKRTIENVLPSIHCRSFSIEKVTFEIDREKRTIENVSPSIHRCSFATREEQPAIRRVSQSIENGSLSIRGCSFTTSREKTRLPSQKVSWLNRSRCIQRERRGRRHEPSKRINVSRHRLARHFREHHALHSLWQRQPAEEDEQSQLRRAPRRRSPRSSPIL